MGMVALGLAGACLLYGDGILTPAITVLGAVEGLRVATTALDAWVVPISVAILIGIFAAQRAGTAAVGRIFGPVTLVWFAAIAALGIRGIVQAPAILGAFNPWHGITFLWMHQHSIDALLTQQRNRGVPAIGGNDFAACQALFEIGLARPVEADERLLLHQQFLCRC